MLRGRQQFERRAEIASGDDQCGVEAERAGNSAQTGEEPPLRIREELEAPIDRGTKRLLPFSDIRAAIESSPIASPCRPSRSNKSIRRSLATYLPGAINIPPGPALAEVLLPDRRHPIVVYGTATSGSAAAVAKRLEELGYATVAPYVGGKEDWVEHDLPLERRNTDNR